MEPWVIIAVAAAAFQTLRFVLQKQLSVGALSAGGATLARFWYSAPFVAALVPLYLAVRELPLPAIEVSFWPYALAGGTSQILATWCVVALFAERNFAVGITFKKTEVVQTALVGFVILGDRVSPLGVAAILMGLVGVLALSEAPKLGGRIWTGLKSRATLLGIASGACFAVSAVGYRGATLAVDSPDPLLRAGLSLAIITILQTAALSFWLANQEPGQVSRVAAAWRTAVWIGLSGLAGSLCWFTAFTLQNAAIVFAVGQVEVIFSILAATLIFGERTRLRELIGMVLITLSVIAVVVVR
ncbi:EamA-like transporter family protein [Roseivivax jejudonensis]|uniref:EamA-like transporter family protein n=1 Tax=Roseivivax jejudonensis TaxID=1529041 RepID=A0A1X6Y632_9RHOB|nr:EamA family transporter [Roseivivax jejudonensis]SLN11763.1 EamA-like transporter family protein [Roseivivax jejudonensis]